MVLEHVELVLRQLPVQSKLPHYESRVLIDDRLANFLVVRRLLLYLLLLGEFKLPFLELGMVVVVLASHERFLLQFEFLHENLPVNGNGGQLVVPHLLVPLYLLLLLMQQNEVALEGVLDLHGRRPLGLLKLLLRILHFLLVHQVSIHLCNRHAFGIPGRGDA